MAQIAKRETSTILHVEGPGIPDNFVEALVATVKMIRLVIDRQLVFNAILREAALCDSIAVTANGCAKKRSTLEVSIDIVEPEHNVVKLSVAVGDFERDNSSAIGCNLRFGALSIGQRVEFYSFTIRFSKRLFLD